MYRLYNRVTHAIIIQYNDWREKLMDFFDIMPLLGILFYLIPTVFVVWFLISFLKTQKERNNILREISEKLE